MNCSRTRTTQEWLCKASRPQTQRWPTPPKSGRKGVCVKLERNWDPVTETVTPMQTELSCGMSAEPCAERGRAGPGAPPSVWVSLMGAQIHPPPRPLCTWGPSQEPLPPAGRWALHHCPISLSRTEQIVYFGFALLRAVTSAVTPRVTNSDGNVTD